MKRLDIINNDLAKSNIAQYSEKLYNLANSYIHNPINSHLFDKGHKFTQNESDAYELGMRAAVLEMNRDIRLLINKGL